MMVVDVVPPLVLGDVTVGPKNQGVKIQQIFDMASSIVPPDRPNARLQVDVAHFDGCPSGIEGDQSKCTCETVHVTMRFVREVVPQ